MRSVLFLWLSLSCWAQAPEFPVIPGGGGGSGVASVGLTMPSWYAVSGSPVTTTGTLAVTAAGAQTSHQVIGTCGSATSFGPCSLVAADLPAPALTINSTLISGGGTNAILYGDGTTLQNATGVTRTAAGTLTFATSVISPIHTAATSMVFLPGTDSTSAMQFQKSGGTPVLTMDTTNTRLIMPSGTNAKGSYGFNSGNEGLVSTSANYVQMVSNGTGVAAWTSGTYSLGQSMSITWNSASGTLNSGVGFDTSVFRVSAGTFGIGKGGTTANGQLNSAGATFFDPTATTGATRVTVSLGAADSASTVTFTNAGTTSSVGVIVSGQPAITGQRFACLTTTGQIVSSATACVGT